MRIRAGRDLEPLPSHWRAMVSTVRWLMPRSAAMLLLGCPASTGPRSGADDWSDWQRMSPRFPANAVPTFGVMSRAVLRGRYLPNLGNDIPLVCSYKGQHEICTCVLMLQPSVAWLPLAKLGRFHFWRLVCCRSE